jgi:hypothetical protein
MATRTNTTGTARNTNQKKTNKQTGWGSRLGDWFARAQTGFAPNARAEFSNFFGNTGLGLSTDPSGFDWSSKSGLKMFGKNVGKGANVLSGVMQGVNAAQNISDYSNTLNSNQDLMSDIKATAMGTPMLSSYLSPDQITLLNKIRNGGYSTSAGADDFMSGAAGGLGGAALSAIGGFATGGIPGAIIGGVGSLVNSGIEGMTEASGADSAQLQMLYQALQDANAQYRAMKRPNFTGLGIQQQYQNMYA